MVHRGCMAGDQLEVYFVQIPSRHAVIQESDQVVGAGRGSNICMAWHGLTVPIRWAIPTRRASFLARCADRR